MRQWFELMMLKLKIYRRNKRRVELQTAHDVAKAAWQAAQQALAVHDRGTRELQDRGRKIAWDRRYHIEGLQ